MTFDFREELGKMTPRVAAGAKIYIFGAGENWEHICKQYKYLVNVDIDQYIDGFIDNDAGKQGTTFHGKQVYVLSDVALDPAVVLISVVSGKASGEIMKQLASKGMVWHHSFFEADCFMALLMRWEYMRIQQFKNKHKGERCFIIGNGPSLLASDLDQLKNEFTFATNKIFLMFDETEWRPSYYAIVDVAILDQVHEEIKRKIHCPVFYAYPAALEIDGFSLNDEYYYGVDGTVNWKPSPFHTPRFSEEPFILHWGATVTYDCLQLAAYMGFEEIYLLGVDFNYSRLTNNNGEIIENNVVNHFSPLYGMNVFAGNVDIMRAAYETARDYAVQHGIKIYNATRGGKLEVFERVDFDHLFKE